jgi:uncharacterized membrane protein (DUF373 family)
VSSTDKAPTPARAGIARAYTIVEDVVYIGLGVLLAGLVVSLLVATFASFGHSVATWSIVSGMARLLDQILVVLLLVELLYTVQVSFREHALMPEPFLLVGLISVIRRVLVLTAVMGEGNASITPSYAFVLELAVLGALILALAVSLALVKRRNGERPTATRG